MRTYLWWAAATALPNATPAEKWNQRRWQNALKAAEIFGGETINDNLITEYCSLCGECVLENTGGLCPVTLCSKGLLNGPCGGAKNGKCEVDPNRDCGWQLIYERLKKIDSLDKMANFATPKNNARWSRPRSLSLGEGEATFRSLSGDRKIVSRA
jgi:hypothetical protein